MGKNRDAARVSRHLAYRWPIRWSVSWVIGGLVAGGCASGLPGDRSLGAGAASLAPAGEIEVAVPFHVIAHRGASGYAPENTLPAFALAREMGAPAVELDVRMSRDGVLVLFHDSTLDLKTELRGPVADHAAATLLETDIGSWFDRTHPGAQRRYAGTTIPALAALFEAQGSALHYHVELKGAQDELPDATLAMIRSHDLMPNVTLTSFSLEQMERVRALDADVRICWLLRDAKQAVAGMSEAARAELLDAQRERVDRAARAGFDQVGIRAAALSREIIDYAKSAHGLEVRAWGVGSTADMEHAIAVGANGMTIDWPDRLLARLRDLAGRGEEGVRR